MGHRFDEAQLDSVVNLFREKMDYLVELQSKEAKDITIVIEEYVQVDKLLYQLYCQQNWALYFHGVSDERKTLHNCAKELHDYFHGSLRKEIHLFPDGFIDECFKDNQPLPLLEGNFLYSSFNPASVFLKRAEKALQLDIHHERYETSLKRSYQNIFIWFKTLLEFNGWNISKMNMRCLIYERHNLRSSLTCLMGYGNTPNILWHNGGRHLDCLTLWHELGHVMHYNLSMANKNFYQFEPSLLVKEIIAFFWEALLLIYVIETSNQQEANAFFNDYIRQTNSYILSAKRLKAQEKTEYESYYPIARYIGELLVVEFLENRISRQQIIGYMCMGATLKATTLIKAAGIKDDNEPVTSDRRNK